MSKIDKAIGGIMGVFSRRNKDSPRTSPEESDAQRLRALEILRLRGRVDSLIQKLEVISSDMREGTISLRAIDRYSDLYDKARAEEDIKTINIASKKINEHKEFFNKKYEEHDNSYKPFQDKVIWFFKNETERIVTYLHNEAKKIYNDTPFVLRKNDLENGDDLEKFFKILFGFIISDSQAFIDLVYRFSSAPKSLGEEPIRWRDGNVIVDFDILFNILAKGFLTQLLDSLPRSK